MQKGSGFRSTLVFFVLINIAWLGLVALWVYYSINNYQIIRRFSLRFQSMPTGVGSNWVVLFGAGILMLFLLLGIIIIYTYYRKQASLTLAHQNFISSVTHELKSPLASIQLYLETLLERNPDEEHRKVFLGRMQEDTERLSSLIQNILWASRIQRLKMDYAFEWVPLSRQLDRYFSDKREKFRWQDEQLQVDLEEDIQLRCDWENLKIALDNLVENAMRYSPSGFCLQVTLTREGDRCKLSLGDRGVGIPKAYQKRVFKMFFRAGNELTRTVEGTGLGLFIVKNILKAHNGKIIIRSGDKGQQGTTFVLELPLEGPKATRVQNILSILPMRRA